MISPRRPAGVGSGAAVMVTAGLVVLLSLWAMTVGSAGIALSQVVQILWHGGDGREALLVYTVRLPRVLAALLIGAALAMSGALLQRLVRNPLADPGLVGVNAGAVLAVILAGLVFDGATRGAHVGAAFGGGLGAAALVWLLAGRNTAPLRLILAGVVVGAFLTALSSSLLLIDAALLDSLRFWTTGSLSGVQMDGIRSVLPWLAAAGLAGALATRPLDAMAMGDETARALGLNLRFWQAITLGAAILLAAGSVALAGPVGFLGLVVPHAVRLVAGPHAVRGLPFWILGGAALTVLADTLPRALTGTDVPVGITLALVGAPAFLALALRRR